MLRSKLLLPDSGSSFTMVLVHVLASLRRPSDVNRVQLLLQNITNAAMAKLTAIEDIGNFYIFVLF